jgi:hypothetical protein
MIDLSYPVNVYEPILTLEHIDKMLGIIDKSDDVFMVLNPHQNRMKKIFPGKTNLYIGKAISAFGDYVRFDFEYEMKNNRRHTFIKKAEKDKIQDPKKYYVEDLELLNKFVKNEIEKNGMIRIYTSYKRFSTFNALPFRTKRKYWWILLSVYIGTHPEIIVTRASDISRTDIILASRKKCQAFKGYYYERCPWSKHDTRCYNKNGCCYCNITDKIFNHDLINISISKLGVMVNV